MNTQQRPTHALTFHRPWAQQIIFGDKRVENRTWKPHKHVRGQRIGIHVGKTLDKSAWEVLEEYASNGDIDYSPLERNDHPGCIIGSAVIAGVRKGGELVMFGDYDARIVDPLDTYYFGSNHYGWILADIIAYVPVECRGHQGLWTIDAEIRSELVER